MSRAIRPVRVSVPSQTRVTAHTSSMQPTVARIAPKITAVSSQPQQPAAFAASSQKPALVHPSIKRWTVTKYRCIAAERVICTAQRVGMQCRRQQFSEGSGVDAGDIEASATSSVVRAALGICGRSGINDRMLDRVQGPSQPDNVEHSHPKRGEYPRSAGERNARETGFSGWVLWPAKHFATG